MKVFVTLEGEVLRLRGGLIVKKSYCVPHSDWTISKNEPETITPFPSPTGCTRKVLGSRLYTSTVRRYGLRREYIAPTLPNKAASASALSSLSRNSASGSTASPI